MAQSGDRRVRRTRAALHQAFLQVMVEKGYEACTVQDVIDRADVGRSTFYAHYGDKAELMRDCLSQLRVLLAGAVPPGPANRLRPLRFSLELFEHVGEQRALLRAMLVAPGAGPVLAEFDLLLAELVRGELEALARDGTPPRVPLDLITDTVVAALSATLRWWAGQDHEQAPAELDRYFQTLIAPGLRAAVPPGPATG